MLGFAPIGSRAISSESQQGEQGITATAAWTEGSEAFAMAITVAAAPAGVTVAAAWTEGSETIAITGTVSAAPVTAVAAWTEGSEIFAATISVSAPVGSGGITTPSSRTVNFGGGTNRVNFDGGTNRVNF